MNEPRAVHVLLNDSKYSTIKPINWLQGTCFLSSWAICLTCCTPCAKITIKINLKQWLRFPQSSKCYFDIERQKSREVAPFETSDKKRVTRKYTKQTPYGDLALLGLVTRKPAKLYSSMIGFLLGHPGIFSRRRLHIDDVHHTHCWDFAAPMQVMLLKAKDTVFHHERDVEIKAGRLHCMQ